MVAHCSANHVQQERLATGAASARHVMRERLHRILDNLHVQPVLQVKQPHQTI